VGRGKGAAAVGKGRGAGVGCGRGALVARGQSLGVAGGALSSRGEAGLGARCAGRGEREVGRRCRGRRGCSGGGSGVGVGVGGARLGIGVVLYGGLFGGAALLAGCLGRRRLEVGQALHPTGKGPLARIALLGAARQHCDRARARADEPWGRDAASAVAMMLRYTWSLADAQRSRGTGCSWRRWADVAQ